VYENKNALISKVVIKTITSNEILGIVRCVKICSSIINISVTELSYLCLTEAFNLEYRQCLRRKEYSNNRRLKVEDRGLVVR
jgi:hypothetical protein